MYQIIYTSRTRASIDHRVMEQIAYLASGRNDTQNVTGLLIYSGNTIVQIIEGEQAAVQAVYDKICRDTRHYDVSILGEGVVARREFPDTPMGFKVVNSESKRCLVEALTDDSPLTCQNDSNRMFA